MYVICNALFIVCGSMLDIEHHVYSVLSMLYSALTLLSNNVTKQVIIFQFWNEWNLSGVTLKNQQKVKSMTICPYMSAAIHYI